MTEKPNKTIHAAFVRVCAGVKNVKRDTQGQVGNQKYKYATLESVLEMLQPLLAVEGLALVQYADGDYLKSTLVHDSGSMMDLGTYYLGEFVDQQKRGSAMTYGRRYQLTAIFGIAQEDDDGASASAAPKSSSKRVFATRVLQNKYAEGIEKLIGNSACLSDLQAVWVDEKETLAALKASPDDFEQQTYYNLEKLKEQAKGVLSGLDNIPEHLRG